MYSIMIPALGLTSWYSLMHGALAPEKLMCLTVRAGYRVCSVTDESNLYGLPELVTAAAQYDMTLIPGVCFKETKNSRLYAWPLDRDGFGTLCAVITERLCTGSSLAVSLLSHNLHGLILAGTNTDLLTRLREECSEHIYYALESGTPLFAHAQAAQQAGIPCLAVVRGCWHDVKDLDRLRLLDAIDRRCRVRDLEKDWDTHMPQLITADAAHSEFSAFPEAVHAAEQLATTAMRAQECFSPVPVFPAYCTYSDAESAQELAHRCYAAIPHRYKQPSQAVHERLAYELRIIQEKRFSAYFLVVQDIVKLCPRTCGRGSGASSIVSYLLGITHIDPLAHDLFFERFLNEARTDPPDIDIDFPWDERHAVLVKIFEQYKDHAGMVADHCTFSVRSAVREAALALGYTAEQAGRFTEQYWYRNTLPEDIRYASSLLLDVPHYIGTHPGGIVITPLPITYYTHLQMSPLGFPVLAWEKDGTEQAGFVKIDILGNRSLAVLRDCIDEIHKSNAGPAIAWNDNSVLNDSHAEELIRSGHTIGIFYIESPATRHLLQKMQRGDFEHLVIASSIIRPAANSYINEFVDRLHGKHWKKLPAMVETVLSASYGIMVYQEDVSRVAIAAAGFSPADADRLRKVLSKKKGMLEQYRAQFFEGCHRNGIREADAAALWAMIESFRGYSFCKAHSASYALVSYQLAWMKAYYPGVFITAVINNGGGFYAVQTYIEEAKRLGFSIAQPSVQHSEMHYTVSGTTIRAGLMQIGCIASTVLLDIVAERNRAGLFEDFFDLLARTAPSYETCRILVRSGACDDIAYIQKKQQTLFEQPEQYRLNRPLMLWVYYQWKRHHGDSSAVLTALPSLLTYGFADYTNQVKLTDELSMLGVLMSTSYADLFYSRAQRYSNTHSMLPFIESDRLKQYDGVEVCLLGIKVTAKEVTASTGDIMSFYSFFDRKGIYETVIFPDTYTQYREILGLYTAFLVCGTVSYDRGAWSVIIHDIKVLSRLKKCLYE